MPRRDYVTHLVILPERPLAECILDIASPALEALAPPTAEARRHLVALAVETWNAQVHASKLWDATRTKPLIELRRRVKGKDAPPGTAEAFERMVSRWKDEHRLDPRLVDTWSLDEASGALTCQVTLPESVVVFEPPPLEKRVRVGGMFLDEARIRSGANSFTGFPITAHRGTRADDGEVVIRTKMTTAVVLLANSRLSPIGGTTTDIMVEGKQLGPMVLTDVRCVDLYGGQDSVELVLRPAPRTNE